MKQNRIEKPRSRRAVLAVVSFALAVAGCAAIFFAFERLRGLWREPSVVRDISAQVRVSDGQLVKGGAVLDAFGIRRGVNLAAIDFETRRREILEQFPSIRAVTVSRLVPDRVEINVVERTPAVRLGIAGSRATTGRVADLEGVVFTCRRGTAMLPLIRERASAPTPVGGRLTGRSLAGLKLIEAAGEKQYSSLGVLEADVSKKDFVLATLGNYAQAKVAWADMDGMDEPNEASPRDLRRRLGHLVKAIGSDIGSDAKVWNATEQDRVYADTREKLL